MIEPIRIILPTVFPMKTVNAWLFKCPEPVLIDCGEKTDQTWKALNDQLEQEGLSISDLKKVIITHAHVDHMGMAGKIARETGAEIWVNEYTADWALDVDRMWNRRGEMFKNVILNSVQKSSGGKVLVDVMSNVFSTATKMWDNIPKENLRVFSVTDTLEFGGDFWQSIYVPGHSNTQTMFYNSENKWLLSADMVLKITPSPVIDAQIEDSTKRLRALPELLNSYKKVRGLVLEKVFPGHYEAIENPYQIIDSQVNRIAKRKEQVFSLIESGTNSFFELFTVMYNGQMNFPGLGMLLGYLDVLEDEARIYREDDESGIQYYLRKNR